MLAAPRRRAIVIGALTLSGSVLAAAVVLAASALPADAQRTRSRGRTQIYLTQKRVPSKLTEEALVRWARGNSTRTLGEDATHKKWVFQMISQFRTPPNDFEFALLFYDLRTTPPHAMPAMDLMVSDRTQRTYVQQVRLDRPAFQPNRDYQLVLTVRHQEMGAARFTLAGQADERSGQVTFSDADTHEPSHRPPAGGGGHDSGGDDGIERAQE